MADNISALRDDIAAIVQFDPKTKAQDLADLFRHPIRIGAEVANPTK